MFKKSKLSYLFLSIILIVSVTLIACSESDNIEKDSSKSVDGDEPYKITLAYGDTGTQDDLKLIEEQISEITKEKINATVELLPINWGAWNQQTNLMLTSDEKLDLIVTSTSFNYNVQAVNGQLVPLDDLIHTYGSGILEVVPEQI